MGHVYARVKVRGSKGEKILSDVLMDSGAAFTVLPPQVVDEVGFLGESPRSYDITLGDGKKAKARFYLLEAELEGRTWPIRVASFSGAIAVIGVDTLETHGLAIDPTARKLVPTRGNFALYV